MKELFNILREEGEAVHRVMATVLESGKPSKTLICGHDIRYCSGERDYFLSNLDEIVNVRTTGVYQIGGRDLYCEVLEEQPELVICGAGHVGAACIRIAATLDMHVTCIEDREEFAERAREMGADEVICSDYAEALDSIRGGDNYYFLAMTRAHAIDQVCLEKILRKRHAYAGMLGSSGKISKLRANLTEQGISEALFDTVHTPVGIDISARTPEEIAIAVLAEIISVRNGGTVKSNAFTQEQLEAIMDSAEDSILVTVIRKRMPSPRDPGTKMLVTSRGGKLGTIGGGAAEAQALEIAREHAADPGFVTEIVTVGDEQNAAGGMVCGGVIDVLLERVDAQC